MIKKELVSSKQLFLIGYTNIKAIDYETNNIVKKTFSIFHLKMEYCQLCERARGVARHRSTAKDHILTNDILTKNVLSGILKADIAEPFPILV